MELSKEDRDVLAHVVIDPDVWVIQAFEGFSHQWNKEKERLERLNELIEQGKQIDPQQKEYYEKRLLSTPEMRVNEALRAKVDRWRPVYLAEKKKPNYKNRVERDVVEEEERRVRLTGQKEAMEKEALIQAKIRELAISELQKEGNYNGLAQPV